MEIGNLLKEKRIARKLTQEQLAEQIFVSTKTISNWENNKTTPDIDSLILLAKLFHLSLDNLLLEGSNVVENIKKIEATKIAEKYFLISWVTNIIFGLTFVTQNFFGKLSLFAMVCLSLGMLLNMLVLFYFTKQLATTNTTAWQFFKNSHPIISAGMLLSLILLSALIIAFLLF